LESVVRQTCPPARIFVVDDGSTDGTEDLVRSFKSEIPIDFIIKQNEGPSAARNVGIARSSSNFIAFLDADDEWIPGKLQEQIRVFSESDISNLGLVYCKYGIIDESGKPVNSYHVVKLDNAVRGNVFEALLSGNRICGSCSGVLVKRECLEIVGSFDESLFNCEDWDLWLRLAEFYGFDYAPMELLKIRRHPGNNQNDTLRMFISLMRFYNKWIARLPDGSDCFDAWRRLTSTYVVNAGFDLSYIKAIIANISADNRRKFFKASFGSFLLYLFFSLPMILMGMVSYELRKNYTNKY
jgi:glycosyltransferase involved in cell wall biosynthesis